LLCSNGRACSYGIKIQSRFKIGVEASLQASRLTLDCDSDSVTDDGDQNLGLCYEPTTDAKLNSYPTNNPPVNASEDTRYRAPCKGVYFACCASLMPLQLPLCQDRALIVIETARLCHHRIPNRHLDYSPSDQLWHYGVLRNILWVALRTVLVKT